MPIAQPHHLSFRLFKLILAGLVDPTGAVVALAAGNEVVDWLSDYLDRRDQRDLEALLQTRLDGQEARIEAVEAAVRGLQQARLPAGGPPQADQLIDTAIAALGDVPPDEREGAEQLIRLAYAGLLRDRELLVRQVETLRRAHATASLIAGYQQQWQADRHPFSALMDANYCVVPFRGRHAELADLERWCMDDRAVLVRLYTGPGGVGKTRLLLAFIRQLPTSPPRERWHAGFLSNHAEVADPVILDHLMTHPDRVLVVIDNAEVRWEEVRAVLSKAAEAEYGRKVRVVLLARGAVEWWEAMKRRPDPVGYLLRAPATTGVSLPRFSLDVRENTATFYDAAQAFAEHLNLDGSNVVMPDLPDHYHDTILLIHMAAFAAIHGQTLSSDHELLDFFLDRERYFWDERKPREISSAAFAQAAAIITGFGGADGPEAACRLIRRARLMRGQPEDKIHQVAEALRSLYPGPRWLNPVQPDLAGERLVQRVLAGQL